MSAMRALLFIFCAAVLSAAGLKDDLLLHASFDNTIDADHAAGDRRLHTAESYKDLSAAKPGLHHPDVVIAKGAGKFGDALQFVRKNTRAVYYPGEKNIAFSPTNWSGTISFWLNLDPETDLEPGYCDPIQVTDSAYNDSAIWVDFTRDDKPRHFRLGIFGDLNSWNPKNIPTDKNPDFLKRLVVVRKTPFAKGRWTHVVITHRGLGSGKGTATLYLNGERQGETETIPENFSWHLPYATIRLGVNYAGLFDELSIFRRPLSAQEVRALYESKSNPMR